MFVYFYNSFPPFESPIYLGNSARLPLRCFITQTLSFLDRGSKPGVPRGFRPSRGPAARIPPEDQLGRTPGSEPPRPPP